MELSDIIKISKIDFTSIIISYDTYVGFDYELDIEPCEFLEYAKSDLSDKSQKGLINSISNAKRAIDCQVDKTLLSLGYDIFKLPSYLHEFVKRFSTNNGDIVLKLSILECLNIAPSKVISDIRKLRHRLEHEYVIPTYKQVSDAIEIAELFINAVENKLTKSLLFEITDKNHLQKLPDFMKSGIVFDFDYDDYIITVSYSDVKISSDKIKKRLSDFSQSLSDDEVDKYSYVVNNSKKEFIAILRMFMSFNSKAMMLDSFKYFLSLINYDVPLDKVCISDVIH